MIDTNLALNWNVLVLAAVRDGELEWINDLQVKGSLAIRIRTG